MQKYSIIAMNVLWISCIMLETKLNGVEIVKDGKTDYVIVANNDIVEKHAAEELSRFVKKMSGAEMRIEQKSLPGRREIRFKLLGKPEADFPQASKLQHDGYLIAASEKEIIIAGHKRRCFLYGIYRILKENGVIWFYPGEEGECCPNKKTLTVSNGVSVINPSFPQRQYLLNGGPGFVPDTYDWLIRNGLQVFGDDPRLEKYDPIHSFGGHILTYLMAGSWENWDKLYAESPELFGMHNGKRAPAKAWTSDSKYRQVCTSNPEVLRRIVDTLKKKVDSYHGKEIAVEFCADDHGYFCECENCTMLDPPEEKKKKIFNTRWWLVINHVAEQFPPEKYPNLTLNVLAYLNYWDPPIGIKPNPNVRVIYCGMSRCYFHAINDPACERNTQRYLPRILLWAKSGAKISNFEYHNCLPSDLYYVPFERAWIQDMKFRHQLCMDGAGLVTLPPNGHYKEPTFKRNNLWIGQWILHFMTAHFFWNIDDNYEKVWNDVCEKYYGPAWPHMRNFRLQLATAIEKFGDPITLIAHPNTAEKIYSQPGVPQTLENFLRQAETAVASDPVRLKRVKKDREFLKKSYAKDVEFKAFETFEPILNGGFEYTQEAPMTPKNKNEWVFPEKRKPVFWIFLPNASGEARILSDTSSERKNYLCIKGENAIIAQMLGRNGQAFKKLHVTMRIRGNGKIEIEFIGKEGGIAGKKGCSVNSNKWIFVDEIISTKKADRFLLHVTGTIDVDDIRITPAAAEEESMPNAMKH